MAVFFVWGFKTSFLAIPRIIKPAELNLFRPSTPTNVVQGSNSLAQEGIHF